jgi:hypothetical protein
MATAISPEAERLAAALSKRLGDGPFTARELAAELISMESPVELIGAFDDALSRAAAADETDELDDTLWGLPPTDEQLTEARRIASRAHDDALQAALADARTRQQAAELLGISSQAVSKRHAAGTLVALSRGRELRFPAWQFYEGSTLPGLADVIAAYPGGVLSLSTWAVTPNADLDGLVPAEALARRGGVERVLAVLEAISPDAW